MKNLFVLALVAFSSFSAQAASVRPVEDSSVQVEWIEGYHKIPAAGDLRGSVTSVYAGSAYALERYLVNVSNQEAPCEGDDCMANQVFEVEGDFYGAAEAIYSRQIDKNTYSIAIVTQQVSRGEDYNPKYKKVKILLRVKFTAEGVSDQAEMKVVDL